MEPVCSPGFRIAGQYSSLKNNSQIIGARRAAWIKSYRIIR